MCRFAWFFFYVSNLLWIWGDGNVPDLIAIQFKYLNWLRIFISRGSQWNSIQVVFKWSSFSVRVFILFDWICLELIRDRRHSMITIINYLSARRSWISSRRFTLKFQKSILIAKIKKKQLRTKLMSRISGEDIYEILWTCFYVP